MEREMFGRLTAAAFGLSIAISGAALAQAWLDEQRIACPLVELDAFPQHADLAVECAPAAILEDICRPMLAAGKRQRGSDVDILGKSRGSLPGSAGEDSLRRVKSIN